MLSPIARMRLLTVVGFRLSGQIDQSAGEDFGCYDRSRMPRPAKRGLALRRIPLEFHRPHTTRYAQS